MGKIGKTFALMLTLIIAMSSLTVYSVSGQSLKPVVTEFSLQYVDNSYDVSPSYKYTKDLYTGETITTTIPGYRVDNKSLVATIKNPPGVNAYNFRWKPQDESSWHYKPFDTEVDQTPPLTASGFSGPPAYASSSEYTLISVISLNHISTTSLDVQVQALYGEYRAIHNTPIQLFEGDYYDYYFDGQASYWSNTQTVTIPASNTSPNPTASPSPTPSPTPDLPRNPPHLEPIDYLLPISIILAVVIVLSLLLFRRHRKTLSQNKPNI
jgi:hypothetical protein